MKHVVMLVKGQTFLKPIAPLAILSGFFDINVTLLCYAKRHGKEYDALKTPAIARVLKQAYETSGASLDIAVNDSGDEKETLQRLHELHPDAVVCQEAQSHYPDVCASYPTYSIAMFIDTLHFALMPQWAGRKMVQHKTYFASDELRQKTEQLCGEKLRCLVTGSPSRDHVIWIDKGNRRPDGSVLFLAPPDSITQMPENQLAELDALVKHVVSSGAEFVVKDRAKSQWAHAFEGAIVASNEESGFPYTSLQHIAATDVHMMCYSTSAYEAQWFNQPVLNIDPYDTDKYVLNSIRSYGLSVFDGNRVSLVKTGFVDAYDRAVASIDRMWPDTTVGSCPSMAILRDIVSEL